MKKLLVKMLALCMALCMMTACGNSAPAEEEAGELTVSFDAYSMFDMAMLTCEYEDGGMEEIGMYDFIAQPGQTVQEVLESNGVMITGAYSENETFEGWMEYEFVITPGEDGFDTYEYIRTSDDLYTLEEVLEKTVEFNVVYTAKWAEHEMDEYYPAEDFGAFIEGYTGVMAITANGGTVTIKSEFPETTEEGMIMSLFNDATTLNETFVDEEMPYSIEVTKDGASPVSFTIYEADAVDLCYGEPEGSGEYFWFDTQDGENVYLYMTNGAVYMENATAEDVYDIVIGDKAYFAIANWE